MTDPSPTKSNIEQSFCRYCRRLLGKEHEIQQAFHTSCHSDVHTYSNPKILSQELPVLEQLAEIIGEPVPQVSEISLSTFGYVIENGKITGLGLYDRSLKSIPESISQLTNLKYLDLSFNELTAFPDWISQYINLQTLNISLNELTAVPDWIGQLTNLQYLNLDINQLTVVQNDLNGGVTHFVLTCSRV